MHGGRRRNSDPVGARSDRHDEQAHAQIFPAGSIEREPSLVSGRRWCLNSARNVLNSAMSADLPDFLLKRASLRGDVWRVAGGEEPGRIAKCHEMQRFYYISTFLFVNRIIIYAIRMNTCTFILHALPVEGGVERVAMPRT